MEDSPQSKKSKKIIIVAVGVAVVTISLVGWLVLQMMTRAPQEPAAPANTEATDMTAQPAAAEAQVEITPDGFVPAEITVAPGTRIVWINTTNTAQSLMPRGGTQLENFGNTETAAQESYVFTFTTSGTYAYASKNSPAAQGVVHVKSAD